jgi:starvation-inducible DNA-binding protein
MNEDLIQELKVLLASTFSFAMKAQNYHINVVGDDFAQYHEFFGEIYEEVYPWADTIGELIRTLDSFTPFSYSRFSELTKISDETTVIETEEMIKSLITDNEILLQTAYSAHSAADAVKNWGITNALEDIITAIQKRHWMLKAFAA